MSAIQLTPIGTVRVPTVTWACLISRTTWAIAKIPNSMLATRNPVVGEFMRGVLGLLEDLSAKNDPKPNLS
jgi:hypothetical protein